MTDWSRSYEAQWRIFAVNPATWQDGDALVKVDSARIERTSDGALLESGSMEAGDAIPDGYYRIVMTAVQDGRAERVEVSTMLFEGASGDAGKGRHRAEGRSVLYPASVRRLLRGAYCAAGADGARYAARILGEAVNAPIEVHGSFTLNSDMVHELGTTVLEAAWSVLSAAGWCMQVDGHGTVHVLPLPTVPALELNRANARLLMPGVAYSDDHSGVPNRYTAIDGASSATALNADLDSPVSTVSRGFVVDVVDDKPAPVDGETLRDYAARMLRGLSTMRDTRTYSREFWPGVLPYSVVRGSMADEGLDGDMRVASQSLECGAGIKVTEKAAKEVQLWQ